MASYNIVLNLKGNAVKNVETLANRLERVESLAQRAQRALQGVSGVKFDNLKPLSDASRGFRSSSNVTRSSNLVDTTSRLVNRSSREERDTWWRVPFGRMQTTFSTGSGFNTTLQFSNRFFQGLGAAALGLSMLGEIAGKVARWMVRITSLNYTVGPKMLLYGANILTSSQMGEGIRLLQRRQQARLGLGERYAEAQERADLLAASYGLDPSNVIASMNVLTGMSIGRTGQRITLGMSERLTQAGGLIAQQSGASFERVMTNIQQMMSQVTPNMRDIREMLNAAPILSKYAMDEITKQGLTGVSSMDWLKDQRNIVTVLNRYMAENPAIGAMQARGIVQRSQTQFYATLAENPDWLQVASQYEDLMKKAASGLSGLVTTFVNSRFIGTSIERIKVAFERLPDYIDKFGDAIDKFILKWGRKLGFSAGVLGDIEAEATRREENRRALKEHVRENIGAYRALYQERGLNPEKDNEAFFNRVVRDLGDPSSYIRDLTADYNWNVSVRAQDLMNERGIIGFTKLSPDAAKSLAIYEVGKSLESRGAMNTVSTSHITGRSFVEVNEALIRLRIADLAREEKKITAPFGGATPLADGDDISGYAKDRKALIINFNDAIVKWDSTIEATKPEDVVDEVSENIEDITARAIQIALLGASQKMSMSW